MTYYSWPPGVRIPDMPDIGVVTDDSSIVGEHVGSGRFRATALRDYIYAYTSSAPGLISANNTGRNILHNGQFMIRQLGPGPFVVNDAINADRWRAEIAMDTSSVEFFSVTDDDRAAIGNDAARIKARAIVAGSSDPGSYTLIRQWVEDVRRLAGKTVTLSFYAKVTAGTARIGASTDQVFGTGGSPSAPVESTGSSVLVSATWARHVIRLTLPPVIGKIGGTNGDDHTKIGLWLSSGSTYSARAGGVPVQSATFELWGLQLEIGTAATPVEMPHYADELGRCRRWLHVGELLWAGSVVSGQGVVVTAPYTPMRGTPYVLPSITLLDNSCINTSAPVMTVTHYNARATATATATANGVIDCTYMLDAEHL